MAVALSLRLPLPVAVPGSGLSCSLKTGLCACANTVASCHHGQIPSDQPLPGRRVPAAAPGPAGGPGAMIRPSPTPPTGRLGNFGPPGALTRPEAASEASITWPSASASGINLSGCSTGALAGQLECQRAKCTSQHTDSAFWQGRSPVPWLGSEMPGEMPGDTNNKPARRMP